jgi:hypothetical protein
MKNIAFRLILLIGLNNCKSIEFEKSLVFNTGALVQIKGKSAQVKGTLADVPKNIQIQISEYGLCWATNPSPTILDERSNLGSLNQRINFISDLVNLQINTTYFIRAYAKWGDNIIYGNEISFKTLAFSEEPELDKLTVLDINDQSISLKTKVLDIGKAPITQSGFCWSINSNPTINDSKIELGSQFEEYLIGNLINLQKNTLYHIRAFAINSFGISYSPEIEVSTLKEPKATGTWSQKAYPPIAIDPVYGLENLGSFMLDNKFHIIDRNEVLWQFDGNNWTQKKQGFAPYTYPYQFDNCPNTNTSDCKIFNTGSFTLNNEAYFLLDYFIENKLFFGNLSIFDIYGGTNTKVELYKYQANTNQWQRKNRIPIDTSLCENTALLPTTIAIQDKIYLLYSKVLGGDLGKDTIYVQEYDASNDTWQLKSKFVEYGIAGYIYAIHSYNDNIYIFGAAPLVVYNTQTNQWQKRNTTDFVYAYSFKINEKVYITNNNLVYNNEGVASNTFEYDFALDKWTRKASIPIFIPFNAWSLGTKAFSINNKGYILTKNSFLEFTP